MFRQLEKHDTKDKKTKEINGELIPLFREWEQNQKNPKMVYITKCKPFCKKGEHLHLKREDNFSCIQGKVVFIIKEDERYKEYIMSDKNPHSLKVPEGVPSAHINIGTQEAIIVNCASTAWHPDDIDNEEVSFNDYDWSKWIPICQKEFDKISNNNILTNQMIINLSNNLAKLERNLK